MRLCHARLIGQVDPKEYERHAYMDPAKVDMLEDVWPGKWQLNKEQGVTNDQVVLLEPFTSSENSNHG